MARGTDGRVVFVPRTAPGELVEVEYIEEHKQWLRARPVRVLESSPDRRDPPCRHYARCGGCQLQHLQYAAQLSVKTAIIIESMRRIGGFAAPPLQAVPSPRELAYTNRISLVMRRKGDGFVAGYHAYDSPSEIVRIDNCPLAEPALNETWSSLTELWGREPGRLPRGQEMRLTLRANCDGEVGLAIEEIRSQAGPSRRRARDRGLAGAAPGLVAVWRLDKRGKIAAHEGVKSLRERSGPYEIPLAGTAFLQVNRDTALRMDACVREQCGDVRGKRVIDAYCGYGLRAIEMARAGGDVTGVDMDRRAIKAGRRMALEAGASVRLLAAAAEHSLPRELPADIVIVNPPRRGMARPVADALAGAPPARIVYVSCNPATLARDLKRLADRHEIAACMAFDLFPQTAHIETVATLTRRKG